MLQIFCRYAADMLQKCCRKWCVWRCSGGVLQQTMLGHLIVLGNQSNVLVWRYAAFVLEKNQVWQGSGVMLQQTHREEPIRNLCRRRAKALSGEMLHLCLRRIESVKVLESCFGRLVQRNQSETFVWRRAEDVLEVCLGRRIINQSKDFVWRCAGYVLLKHSERFRLCLECLEICCRYAGDVCLEKCWRCAYS